MKRVWPLRFAQLRHYSKPPISVFSLTDIPLSSFQSIISRSPAEFSSSPSTYYSCAQRLISLIHQGADPYSVPLAKHGYPPDVVHSTACILLRISRPRSAHALATALWSSSSSSGYRPSTLSLARQLIRSNSYGKLPALKPVEARFDALVSSAGDPDALTARGELLYERASYEAAVRVLQRALQISGEFEWKPHCRLCLAKAYLRTNRRAEGLDMLRALAGEGVLQASVELGEALAGEEADGHFYVAACGGRIDLFARLAESAVERGEDEWAKEWSRLADPRAEH